LNCVYDSISQIMRKNVEKRALFENLDIIMLALDEICDGGIVLESDPQEVVNRVALRTDDIPLGEQTVAQVKAKIGTELNAKMAATSAVSFKSVFIVAVKFFDVCFIKLRYIILFFCVLIISFRTNFMSCG